MNVAADVHLNVAVTVDVHLSSGQVTYDLIWMLTCIIVFYCVWISKVSVNFQYVLVYDAIFWFNLVCIIGLILLVFYYISYCHTYSPAAFAS